MIIVIMIVIIIVSVSIIIIMSVISRVIIMSIVAGETGVLRPGNCLLLLYDILLYYTVM